jgi:2-(1,2-epoxy-1,2-dihydrophenyl)acetyl-CoA isomerase
MEGSMEFERALLDRVGAVAILSMNHPEVLNAVSPEMLKGMTDALDALADSSERTRCLVITGVGRAFSTGANLQDAATARCRVAPARRWRRCIIPFLRRLCDLPYPIITAVNGPAAGAGMSIALMGDLIVCARSAYFLQAFRRIGLVPDCGSTWLLPRLIGRGARSSFRSSASACQPRSRSPGASSIASSMTRR